MGFIGNGIAVHVDAVNKDDMPEEIIFWTIHAVIRAALHSPSLMLLLMIVLLLMRMAMRMPF